MCTTCGGARKTSTSSGGGGESNQYRVIYPEGSGKPQKVVYSKLAAQIAAAAVEGARWEKVGG